MRRIAASLLVTGSLVSSLAAGQARSGTAADAQRISACSLLTPEIASKYVTSTTLKYTKPEETPRGQVGTVCEYGRIRLLVNPFGRGTKPKAPDEKGWEPQPGLGDAAFYRTLNNTYAEIITWSGPNTLGMQLGKNTGATMETTRTEAIALAKELLPKLK
jgi:hypothetical protein